MEIILNIVFQMGKKNLICKPYKFFCTITMVILLAVSFFPDLFWRPRGMTDLFLLLFLLFIYGQKTYFQRDIVWTTSNPIPTMHRHTHTHMHIKYMQMFRYCRYYLTVHNLARVSTPLGMLLFFFPSLPSNLPSS